MKDTFLHRLDDDLRRSVVGQLRDLWTYHSTAIEGNSLTLAETHLVLAEGLTVKGKPVKDHNEVLGHTRAIDLLFSMLGREVLVEDLFTLHRAVMAGAPADIMRPTGSWKGEPNGAWRVVDGERAFVEFAAPADVPGLMDEWLMELNRRRPEVSVDDLVEVYAHLHVGFTSIHPFADGNGRLARLLSNVPLLQAGHPPLVVNSARRRSYIAALGAYSEAAGSPTAVTGVWPADASCGALLGCLQDDYLLTWQVLEEARAVQQGREGKAST